MSILSLKLQITEHIKYLCMLHISKAHSLSSLAFCIKILRENSDTRLVEYKKL